MATLVPTPWSTAKRASDDDDGLLSEEDGPTRLQSLVTLCLDRLALLLRFSSLYPPRKTNKFINFDNITKKKTKQKTLNI
jgi:hypothetical protein